MARTLSNGIIIPESDDTGRVIFAALESNFQRLNEVVPEQADQRSIQLNIVPSQWVSSFPSGFQTTVSWDVDFNGVRALFSMFLQPSNERVFLRYKVNTNNLIVYTNDRSITVKILGVLN